MRTRQKKMEEDKTSQDRGRHIREGRDKREQNRWGNVRSKETKERQTQQR